MKFTTTIALALSASAGVLAQTTASSPLASIAGMNASSFNISSQCQQAAVSLGNSSLVSCLQVPALLPLLTNQNGSVIPVLDKWMTAVCASAPCNQTAFDMAAATLSTGCASDFQKYGYNATMINKTLVEVFDLYPVVRELVCLKTTKTNTTIANITSTASKYNGSTNTTNGTFCVTSLLEQVEGVAGFNLSITNLVKVGTQAYNGNFSALKNFTNLPPTALCQDCIFAAADIVGEVYPQLWRYPIDTKNTTIGGFLNGTCSAQGYNVTYNGMLPSTIIPSAINSTYPYNLTAGNYTYRPGPNVVLSPKLFNSSTISGSLPSATASLSSLVSSRAASATSGAVSAAKRDVTAPKRRWVGSE